MLVEIPVSVGELIDRITILEIKMERANPDERAKINAELADLYLKECATDLRTPLKQVNELLWGLEDLIRNGEDVGVAIHHANDVRANLKMLINKRYGHPLFERKIY